MAKTVAYVPYLVNRTLREIRTWADAKANGKSGDYFDVFRLCDEALMAIEKKRARH